MLKSLRLDGKRTRSTSQHNRTENLEALGQLPLLEQLGRTEKELQTCWIIFPTHLIVFQVSVFMPLHISLYGGPLPLTRQCALRFIATPHIHFISQDCGEEVSWIDPRPSSQLLLFVLPRDGKERDKEVSVRVVAACAFLFASFTIQRLGKISHIPVKFDGHTVYAEWRRGSKRTSGITKRVLVEKVFIL